MATVTYPDSTGEKRRTQHIIFAAPSVNTYTRQCCHQVFTWVWAACYTMCYLLITFCLLCSFLWEGVTWGVECFNCDFYIPLIAEFACQRHVLVLSGLCIQSCLLHSFIGVDLLTIFYGFIARLRKHVQCNILCGENIMGGICIFSYGHQLHPDRVFCLHTSAVWCSRSASYFLLLSPSNYPGNLPLIIH